MKSHTKTLIWLTLFSISMGFLETAVVVYLRKIYYPEGFHFPLTPIEQGIAVTEFLREAATLMMLLGIGILTGKTAAQKFAFFIYSFAIWDLFYYVFLKLLLNWPESIFTWDILFLIPVPWVGPVIAPCIVSLTMITLALSVVYFQEKGLNTKINVSEWILLCLGSITVILSFLWDYFQYVQHGYSINEVWTLTSKADMFNEINNYIPQHYNWWLFISGELTIAYAITKYVRRMNNE